MAAKLTDKIVRGLPAPASGNRITYDNIVHGFGVRVTAAGSIAFVLTYRRKDGLQRRCTIGSFPDWSVTAAREEAKRLKREIDGGGDPVGHVRADREAPTVVSLCARFQAEHSPRLRPSTRRMYDALIANRIIPALGGMKVAAVEYEHVDRLHCRISQDTPYLANRILGLLSKMFALAVRWRLRPDNPVRGVERNQEHKRERFLSAEELERLTDALREYRNQEVADVFRLLLLTGARKGEVLGATWDQFDLGKALWRKPAATTKQKLDHEIPLSAPARQLIAAIRQRHDDATFLFPGPGPQRYRTGVKKHWGLICKAAGITARIHDLRHTHASLLIEQGYSLPLIGALLGHTRPETTQRYAHLSRDPLREATERVGAIVSGRKLKVVMP
jgi:integrase